MIQALLLDFDGVLRSWETQYDIRAEQATGISAERIRRVAFEPELLKSAITGTLSDEQWRAEVVVRLQRSYPPLDAAEAVRLWSASPGRIDPAVLELVQRCRNKVVVVLVTNATSRLPRDLERLGLSDTFDAVVNSSEVGAAKPDAQIYVAALEAAGVPAAASLFVDDSPGHVEGARRVGVIGHLYRGEEQLERFLRQHSVL